MKHFRSIGLKAGPRHTVMTPENVVRVREVVVRNPRWLPDSHDSELGINVESVMFCIKISSEQNSYLPITEGNCLRCTWRLCLHNANAFGIKGQCDFIDEQWS